MRRMAFQFSHQTLSLSHIGFKLVAPALWANSAYDYIAGGRVEVMGADGAMLFLRAIVGILSRVFGEFFGHHMLHMMYKNIKQH